MLLLGLNEGVNLCGPSSPLGHILLPKEQTNVVRTGLRFSLYYYCDRTFKDPADKKETKLTVITSKKKAAGVPEFDADDEAEEPPLESLIRTK
jgi:hypothetical protein